MDGPLFKHENDILIMRLKKIFEKKRLKMRIFDKKNDQNNDKF